MAPYIFPNSLNHTPKNMYEDKQNSRMHNSKVMFNLKSIIKDLYPKAKTFSATEFCSLRKGDLKAIRPEQFFFAWQMEEVLSTNNQ